MAGPALMTSKIGLIRHGITEGNLRRLYYGKTDVPLAEEGVQELQRLAGEGVYPDSEGAIFFTTGLGRTAHTMELIYGDRPHQVIPELQEINFGAFEMKSYEELLENEDYRDWITAENLTKAPPGGESILEFNDRVIRGYEALRRAHSLHSLSLRHRDAEAMSVAICHGGTISAIMAHIWPEKYDNIYGWIPDPGHGYVLTLEDNIITGYEEF